MGKKDKKAKKVNAKKERYAKFRKERSGIINTSMPELTPEQMKQKQEDEAKISGFLRFNRNPPTHEIVERREKSKR